MRTPHSLIMILSLACLAMTSCSQASRRSIPGLAESHAAISVTLDDFHDAAAVADEARYFGHFTPDAVFLGTDATERWTFAQFREFSRPHFEKESAWTFVPTSRNLAFDSDHRVAWFDEHLESEHLGLCRGTGVLEWTGGAWKISHYNLTIPIPNELAKEFVARIREADSD